MSVIFRWYLDFSGTRHKAPHARHMSKTFARQIAMNLLMDTTSGKRKLPTKSKKECLNLSSPIRNPNGPKP